MKIYTLMFDMTAVLPRLKKFKLQEFNSSHPKIFVEADDPDGACYEGYCRLSEILLKHDDTRANATFAKKIMDEVRITKVKCK